MPVSKFLASLYTPDKEINLNSSKANDLNPLTLKIILSAFLFLKTLIFLLKSLT